MDFLPVRPLLKSNTQDGAWIVAKKAAERRRFKAIICALNESHAPINNTTGESTDIEQLDQANTFSIKAILELCKTVDPKKVGLINISMRDLLSSENDFHEFSSVYKIDASGNKLNLNSFFSFPHLEELSVSGNELRQLPAFPTGSLSLLRQLDLSHNRIPPDQIGQLGELPNLRCLCLSGNRLNSLPQDLLRSEDGISRFTELEDLDLSDNRLSSFDVFAVLGGFKKLKKINLSHNRFEGVPLLRSNFQSKQFHLVAEEEDLFDYDGNLDTEEQFYDNFDLLGSEFDLKSNFMRIRIPSTLPEVDEETTAGSKKDSEKSKGSISVGTHGGSTRTIELHEPCFEECDPEDKDLERSKESDNQVDESYKVKTQDRNANNFEQSEKIANVKGDKEEVEFQENRDSEAKEHDEKLDNEEVETTKETNVEELETTNQKECNVAVVTEELMNKNGNEYQEQSNSNITNATEAEIVEENPVFKSEKSTERKENKEDNHVSQFEENEQYKADREIVEKIEDNDKDDQIYEKTRYDENEEVTTIKTEEYGGTLLNQQEQEDEKCEMGLERSRTILDLKVDPAHQQQSKTAFVGDVIAENEEDPLYAVSDTMRVVIDQQISKLEVNYEEHDSEAECAEQQDLDPTSAANSNYLRESTSIQPSTIRSLNGMKSVLMPEKSCLNFKRDITEFYDGFRPNSGKSEFSVYGNLNTSSVTEMIRYISTGSAANRDGPQAFATLELLDMSFNRINDERALIPMIAWPSIHRVIVHDNPLTLHRTQKASFIKALLENTFHITVDWLTPLQPLRTRIFPCKSEVSTLDRVVSLPSRSRPRSLDTGLLTLETVQSCESELGSGTLLLPRLRSVTSIMEQAAPNLDVAVPRSLMPVDLASENALPNTATNKTKSNRISALRRLRFVLEHPLTCYNRQTPLHLEQQDHKPIQKRRRLPAMQSRENEYEEKKKRLAQQRSRVCDKEIPLGNILQYRGCLDNSRMLMSRIRVAEDTLTKMQARYNHVREASLGTHI